MSIESMPKPPEDIFEAAKGEVEKQKAEEEKKKKAEELKKKKLKKLEKEFFPQESVSEKKAREAAEEAKRNEEEKIWGTETGEKE